MENTEVRESSAKIREFTTTLLRKIRQVEYKNAHLVPGYEKTEQEYISLRNSLENANLMIKNLMSYEHGNRFLKAIKNSVQNLSDKASMNIFKNKDIFEDMSSMARRMSMMNLDPSSKGTAEKVSVAYKKVSESKKVLNERLENIRLQLKERRNHCIEIDKHRKKVKNMRYELEMLLQDNGYNNEIREAEKKEFSEFSSQTLKMMIHFIEDASIGTVLKSVSKEYSNHLKETSQILKDVE